MRVRELNDRGGYLRPALLIECEGWADRKLLERFADALGDDPAVTLTLLLDLYARHRDAGREGGHG